MEQVIGQVGHDRTKQTQVNITEYNGITGVDIREFYLGGDNKMHPTKKGIRIGLTKIKEVVTLLEKAEEILIKSNQIPNTHEATTTKA